MSDAVYVLPDLPYDHGALETHISGRIMELHHGKHHAAYVKGANDALERLAGISGDSDFGAVSTLEKDLAFHVSGHVLHSVLWTNLAPDGGGEPTGELAATIDAIWNVVNWVDVGRRFEAARACGLVTGSAS